jgi:5-methylcytosine-specific restriction endonuclease McrA
VRAITRVADAESEAELLGHASEMSAAALERLVRSWRRPGPSDEAAVEARRHASRCLSVFPDEDGSYLIRGKLDPEVGALLMRAIEAASDALFRGSVPETTPEQRRADALGLLAERAFAAGFAEAADERRDDAEDDAGRGAPAERYMVVLHVDQAATLEDGTPVSAETSRRWACDASVIRGASRTRVVPPRMRRALQLRDRGCRFPGCGSRFTDAHHIRHWADGGPTEVDNLVLLCRVHHRLLHEGGFRLEPNPKRPGRPDFLTPRGIRIPEAPPPMRIGGRRVGGPASRWEEEVPLALYLRGVGGVG